MADSHSLLLFNTMSGQKELFTSITPSRALMYHCGPTVYDFAHIGNLKKYINDDTLRRALVMNGYETRQVINITDIGHLTSDADTGDDKMVNAIKREGLAMTMESLGAVATKYANSFIEDITALNIQLPNEMPRASEWIPEQIKLIERLFERGLAYDASEPVYFEVSKFPEYGKLGHIHLEGQKEGARVSADSEKRGPYDFALWKKNPAMGFASPWGKGFPGWHIECSAMAMSILGDHIDIHTGGIDHIPVHHNNEIAQSEGATGITFTNYWLHSEFITVNDTKMSKSKGNFATLRDLMAADIHPLSYRYWVLNGHYRSAMNFSEEAILGAQTALERLHSIAADTGIDSAKTSSNTDQAAIDSYLSLMQSAINNDLNTSGVIAPLWQAIDDKKLTPGTLAEIIRFADSLLGLSLADALSGNSPILPSLVSIEELPTHVQAWVRERESLRTEKRFAEADLMREKIAQAGYSIEDAKEGIQIKKKRGA